MLDISERVGELRHGREFVREPFDVDLPRYDLVGVEEEAASAGLKPGDRITRINDQPLPLQRHGPVGAAARRPGR